MIGSRTLIVCGALAALAGPNAAGSTYALGFSTYLGGSGIDTIRDVATDAQGNIYITGGTTSRDFPTTAGAYQKIFGGGGASLGSHGAHDIAVAKFTPAGRLIWSTYVGGPNYDRAYGIEVDPDGYVYLAGRAGDGFPTTPGVIQPKFGGDYTPLGAYGKQDGFIAKFSPDGSRLLWSTYFGGRDGGFIRDIDIDRKSREVFVVMAGVRDPFLHITPGVLGPRHGGGHDIVVAKISADGSKVRYATHLGGSGDDGGGPTVRVDAAGCAHVVGSTTSKDIPTTAGAYSRKLSGGRDVYVAKLSPDGSKLLFATYLGGSDSDDTNGTHNLVIDNEGNVYVNGSTQSKDFPTTPGAIRRKFDGNKGDKYMARISADGTRLLASTFLYGTGEGLAVDSDGNVYSAGETRSPSFPVTPDAYQKTMRGGDDAVVLKVSGDLSKVLFGTYMGGASQRRSPPPPGTPVCEEWRQMFASLPSPPPAEALRGLAIDEANNIVVGGYTDSSDWPTLNAHQAKYGGCGADDVIVKFLLKK